MRFGSLFSGIGGLDLGLEWAGMECAWQVEIDEFCLSVLERHWPDVPRFKEVRDVGKENLGAVDLIAGGFPCQPHSVAGKRRGAADDRNLWPEFSRIIAELRPRYVLAENVLGIRTTYLDTVLSDLEDQGYACGTFDIPAVAFDAPHRRHRIFIVGYASNGGCGGQPRRGTGQESEDGHSQLQEGAIPNAEGWQGDERGRGDLAQATDGRQSCNASAGPCGEVVPHRKQSGLEGRGRPFGSAGEFVASPRGSTHGTGNVPDANGAGRQIGTRQSQAPVFGTDAEDRTTGGIWLPEPRLGELVDGLPPELAGRLIRVATRIPDRVAKLRALGNAVVPQVAEWIGRRILELDATLVTEEEKP